MSTHCSTEQQLLHIIYFLDQNWLKTPELINIFSIQLFKKSGLIFILFLFCLYPPNGIFGCRNLRMHCVGFCDPSYSS